jgi:hypothetical protein
MRLISEGWLSSSQARPTSVPAKELEHVGPAVVIHPRRATFSRCDPDDVRVRIVEAVEDAADGEADGGVEQRTRVDA